MDEYRDMMKQEQKFELEVLFGKLKYMEETRSKFKELSNQISETGTKLFVYVTVIVSLLGLVVSYPLLKTLLKKLISTAECKFIKILLSALGKLSKNRNTNQPDLEAADYSRDVVPSNTYNPVYPRSYTREEY